MNKRSSLRGAFFAAALFLVSVSAAKASVDSQSEQVIRDSGAAMGLQALQGVRVMRIDANVKAVGLSGSATRWHDLSSLRFAESLKLPPLETQEGFDGEVAWNRDQAGLVWDDGGSAGYSKAINDAYVSSNALWKPNAGGASVSYEGRKTEKDRAYDVLRVEALPSKVPCELWFDATSHLLIREVQALGPNVDTIAYSDYRSFRGLMVPYVAHVESTSGNNVDLTVTAVSFDPPDAAAHLVRPVSQVHDFSMQRGKTATTVPFELSENHVYVDVMLNGKGPYHMIFDTGGSNVVDTDVAKEIGATGAGSAQGQGVGAATETFGFAKVATLQVGDALLKDQMFATLPVRAGFGISAGRTADGIIGWEVLARYVTTFDYQNGRVVLAMPGKAGMPKGADVLPFVFHGTQPEVACTIDGIDSRCAIDTGARDTLTLLSPYVAQHPRVEPSTVTANGVTGFGVGGAAMGKLGRLQTLTLGRLTLHDLIGDYSTSTRGAFAEPFLAANLGGNLLRRFNVTFDYGHQRMGLVPNAAFAQRDAYERSGLFVVNLGGKMTVADSRPGTPAASAGITKGDVIVSINGTPTSGMMLAKLRDYFWQPPGTTLTLELANKSGEKRTVMVTLRDYV